MRGQAPTIRRLSTPLQIDAVSNLTWLVPLFHGGYPDDLLANSAHIIDWSFVRDADIAEIAQPIDVLGLN